MPRIRFNRAPDIAPPRARNDAGFTLIEVLITIVVLTVGLLGTFAALRTSAHTTLTNRERQAETSLAREALEDAGSLPIAQLTTAALPSALQTVMPGARLVAGQLQVTRAHVTYLVSPLTACSVDDPSDGYGSHTNPAQWCSNPTPTSPADPTPDNQERVSLTVQPTSGASGPVVEQSTLIANRPPVLTGVSPSGTGCVSGPPVSCTGGQTLSFSVATATSATLYRWFVNGTLQAGATTSQFTWTPTNPSNVAGYTATYTISAQAEYGQGPWSPASTLQVSVTF